MSYECETLALLCCLFYFFTNELKKRGFFLWRCSLYSTHRIRIRPILVWKHFCLAMTHQAHLQRRAKENGSFLAEANRQSTLVSSLTLKWSSRSLPTAYGAPITTSDTYWREKKTAGSQLFPCHNWADEEDMLKGQCVCSLLRQQVLELAAGHSNCVTVCCWATESRAEACCSLKRLCVWAHPTGQDTQRPLVDVHDRIVLPLVPIHFLQTHETDCLLLRSSLINCTMRSIQFWTRHFDKNWMLPSKGCK